MATFEERAEQLKKELEKAANGVVFQTVCLG